MDLIIVFLLGFLLGEYATIRALIYLLKQNSESDILTKITGGLTSCPLFVPQDRVIACKYN